MRKLVRKSYLFIGGVLVAVAFLNGQAAQAGSILWYNGNLDQRDALTNQTGAADGLIYDDFIVPVGKTFTITAVYSNDAMYQAPTASTTAYFEIRSGVSTGHGGTLLASGNGSDVSASTGQTFSSGGVVLPVYTNEITGLNTTLGPGTYWLAVAPNVSNQDSYIVTTSGAGAIGTPPGNDGNSFMSSTFFGFNFLPTSDPSIEGPGTWDYSMGIIGTSANTAVPEPSSFVLGLIGSVASAAFAKTRRNCRS